MIAVSKSKVNNESKYNIEQQSLKYMQPSYGKMNNIAVIRLRKLITDNRLT